MKITGENNEIAFLTADEKLIDTNSAKWQEILDKSNINIIGSGNRIEMKFAAEDKAAALLASPGLNISIIGNGNSVKCGILSVYYNKQLGSNGLNIMIGRGEDELNEPGILRTANNCSLEIGNRTTLGGLLICLQDDGSHIRTGEECIFSWGIDLWCTDVHTITDLAGNSLNRAESIEIGRHVWIGKDVKIGKNTRIGSDSIVGWNSVVTRRFDEPNVIIAGSPAKIIKREINWNARTQGRYEIYYQKSRR